MFPRCKFPIGKSHSHYKQFHRRRQCHSPCLDSSKLLSWCCKHLHCDTHRGPYKSWGCFHYRFHFDTYLFGYRHCHRYKKSRLFYWDWNKSPSLGHKFPLCDIDLRLYKFLDWTRCRFRSGRYPSGYRHCYRYKKSRWIWGWHCRSHRSHWHYKRRYHSRHTDRSQRCRLLRVCCSTSCNHRRH